MSGFQIVLLIISLYFAWEVYKFITNTDFDEELKKQKENSGTIRLKFPEVNKDSIETLMQKTQKAIEYEDYAGALDYLNKAKEIDSNNPEIFAKLGFVYEKKNQYEEAQKNYLHAIKLDHNDDRFHLAIASLYRKMGKPHEALNHYEKALAIDPDYAITYYNYGNLLFDMNKIQEAKNMYKKAIELDNELEAAKDALREIKNKE